jgi:type I restriction enzyme S subunit
MSAENNVPAIRFEGFSGEWEDNVLGSIADVKTGPFGSTLHAEDYVEDGEPIITTEHFKSGALPKNKVGIPQVSDDDYLRLKSYLLQLGDIVFSRVGSVDINAHVTMFQNGWLFSGRVLRVRTSDSIDSEFLHYELSTERVKKSVVSRAVGQTMPSINTEILKITPVNVPVDVKEQAKIGNYFQQLDTLIAQHQKKHDKLLNLKKALLEKMFTKQGATEPAIRFAGFSGEWEEKAIKVMFKVTRGDVLAATETSNSKTTEKPYPVYSSQTKNDGLMGYYKDFLFENAITWTTDGANAGTVNFRKGKFYSTNVNGVLLSDKGYANKTIAEILNLTAWKHVSHVGNPKLMNNVMSEIKITTPSDIEEQNTIAKLLDCLDASVIQHQAQLKKLNNIKQACLEKMFV